MMLVILPLLLLSCVTANTLQGQALTVTAFPRFHPFMFQTWQDGQTRYEGIIDDLLKELSTRLGFSYEIKEVADSRYGMLENSGEWSGMVGEVMRGEADMAAADLTITAAREEVVDFTHPFMYLGLGILYTKNTRALVPAITSLEDLVDQNAIMVGATGGGSTEKFFKNSQIPLYQKIWKQMLQNYDSVMTSHNAEGMDKVLAGNGRYAFIMETPTLAYMTARNCRLTKIGRTFNMKSYGLALPKGSPHREELSLEILKLQESGRIEEITHKWIGLQNATCLIENTSTLLDWFL